MRNIVNYTFQQDSVSVLYAINVRLTWLEIQNTLGRTLWSYWIRSPYLFSNFFIRHFKKRCLCEQTTFYPSIETKSRVGVESVFNRLVRECRYKTWSRMHCDWRGQVWTFITPWSTLCTPLKKILKFHFLWFLAYRSVEYFLSGSLVRLISVGLLKHLSWTDTIICITYVVNMHVL